MITLRLDPLLENQISSAAKTLGLTKSDLIRKSILEYLGNLEKPSAWESGKDLFGRHASGTDYLAMERKTILKEKIRAKRK